MEVFTMHVFKRIGLLFCVATSIFIGSQFIQSNTAFAEDIWFATTYEEGKTECYIDTDSIYTYQGDTYVTIKEVTGQHSVVLAHYRFIPVEDYITVNMKVSGYWRFVGRVYENDWCTLIWNSLQPYL